MLPIKTNAINELETALIQAAIDHNNRRLKEKEDVFVASKTIIYLPNNDI